MKIQELLEGVIKGSSLPSAPSLNDQPDDVEDELDDQQDGEQPADDGDNGDYVDGIKAVSGDLGRDLYSITVYNTADNFANIDQDVRNSGLLDEIDDPVVQSYLRQSNNTISNEKMISCLIMNARNGKFVAFSSGEDSTGLSNDAGNLLSSGVIDSDQVNILKDIEAAGKRYNNILGKVSWTPGEEAEGRGAEMLYNTLDRLKMALSLKEPVDKIKNTYISPEQKAKNKEMSAKIEQRAKEKFLARKAARAPAPDEAGREKR
jgi:hypothetical protein